MQLALRRDGMEFGVAARPRFRDEAPEISVPAGIGPITITFLDLPARLLAAGQPVLPENKNQWLIYGMIAMAIAYIILRPKMRRKKSDAADSGPRFGLSQQRAVEREMSNLVVELSQMARQITGQLDTRATKLELLIQEADQKIAELRQLKGGAAKSPEADAGKERPSYMRVAGETAESSLDERTAEAPENRHADVYHLADEGRSPQQIAQQLSRPRGEVELILALRR